MRGGGWGGLPRSAMLVLSGGSAAGAQASFVIYRLHVHLGHYMLYIIDYFHRSGLSICLRCRRCQRQPVALGVAFV